MRSALWPLQKAIFERLSNDAALQAKGVTVYDVDDEAECPYITIGEDDTVPWNTKDIDGEETTSTFHVWSEYPGKKEAKEILSLMLESLTSAPLSLESGFFVSFSGMESIQVLDDPDGVTKHGIMRVRFNTKG